MLYYIIAYKHRRELWRKKGRSVKRWESKKEAQELANSMNVMYPDTEHKVCWECEYSGIVFDGSAKFEKLDT